MIQNSNNLQHFIFVSDNETSILSIIGVASGENFMKIMLDLKNNSEEQFSLKSLYPLFIGWFWSDREEAFLHLIGQQCLAQLFSLEVICNQLQDKVHSQDLNDYWSVQVKRLHVTSIFLGRHKCEKNDKYISLVRKEFYKTNTLTVSGLLLTPRTLSGHVELAKDAEWMFGEMDMIDLQPHVTLAVGPHIQPVQSGYDQVTVQKKIHAGESCLKSYEIDLGIVEDWGDCNFYVKLKHPLTFDGLFCPQY